MQFTRHSVGIETADGRMATVIGGHTALPATAFHYVSPYYRRQYDLLVSVFEGDSDWVCDNRWLGEIWLDHIRLPRTRDQPPPLVKVTFEIDASLVLKVTVEDHNSRVNRQLVIALEPGQLPRSGDDAFGGDRTQAMQVKNTPKNEYHKLLDLDDANLVTNGEAFKCAICLEQIAVGRGIVLRECLHSFCRDCLHETVERNEEVRVRCPFQDDTYRCECTLQDREVRELASSEGFTRYLLRSLSMAEQSTPNSFHCVTPDCPGWCLLEAAVLNFHCDACGHHNCLNCRAIHEGRDCRQYQRELAFKAKRDRQARLNIAHLENLLVTGQAMRCPQCQVIIIKNEGCDGFKCTVCNLDLCWATKGPRWGPAGKGDISGGCKCNVNGKKCHPTCQYCH